MGQQIGRMPDTWEKLLEERDRVLHWSAEVLARVDDNITNEDTFLMDFDNTKIDEKVAKWIESNNKRFNVEITKITEISVDSEQCRAFIRTGTAEITEDIQQRMRKQYKNAYSELKKLNKKVDKLGIAEKKIHGKIKALEVRCHNDAKKFQKKFGPLRLKVFNNLRSGEKMLFEEKRLKTAFTKKVYEIDHRNMAVCEQRMDKLLKDYEKYVQK